MWNDILVGVMHADLKKDVARPKIAIPARNGILGAAFLMLLAKAWFALISKTWIEPLLV